MVQSIYILVELLSRKRERERERELKRKKRKRKKEGKLQEGKTEREKIFSESAGQSVRHFCLSKIGHL